MRLRDESEAVTSPVWQLGTDDVVEITQVVHLYGHVLDGRLWGGHVRALCKFFMPDTKGRMHTGEHADRLVHTERGWRIDHRMVKERRCFDPDYRPRTLLEAVW